MPPVRGGYSAGRPAKVSRSQVCTRLIAPLWEPAKRSIVAGKVRNAVTEITAMTPAPDDQGIRVVHRRDRPHQVTRTPLQNRSATRGGPRRLVSGSKSPSPVRRRGALFAHFAIVPAERSRKLQRQPVVRLDDEDVGRTVAEQVQRLAGHVKEASSVKLGPIP